MAAAKAAVRPRPTAGHAADPAKENAASHSAVGTAVAFGVAREATNAAEADLAALEAELAALEAELVGLVDADLAAKEVEIAAKEAEIAAKEAEVAGLGMAEQAALEAAVKDPTPSIADALADLLGIDRPGAATVP